MNATQPENLQKPERCRQCTGGAMDVNGVSRRCDACNGEGVVWPPYEYIVMRVNAQSFDNPRSAEPGVSFVGTLRSEYQLRVDAARFGIPMSVDFQSVVDAYALRDYVVLTINRASKETHAKN